MITTEDMVLDAKSDLRSKFFDPYVAASLHDPNASYDETEDQPYSDFDSDSEDLRGAKDGALFVEHYFSSYIYSYLFTDKYNDEDTPWSTIGCVLSFGPCSLMYLTKHLVPAMRPLSACLSTAIRSMGRRVLLESMVAATPI
jgi:hypothetical protein